MSPGKRYQLVLVLVIFGIAGCESTVPVRVPGNDDYVTRVREEAVRLEKVGDLSRAVYQWQVIAGLKSNDQQAKTELKRLRKTIANKIRQLESDFESARAEGKSKRQNVIALKLLALDGRHSTARGFLQSYERKSALLTQSQKDRDALQAQAMRQEKASQQLLLDKQKQQSETKKLRAKADAAAKLAKVKTRKGDDLYLAGIQALSVDLDKAIALLSESLEYNPGNAQAKQHIQRAKKMQATLKKIEQTRSGN